MYNLLRIVFLLECLPAIDAKDDVLAAHCSLSKEQIELKLKGHSKVTLSVQGSGSENAIPVIILSSEHHHEWDRLADALCLSGRHQIAIGAVKSQWMVQLWNAFNAIDAVLDHFQWDKAVIFAKANAAFMSLKYMQRNSSAVKKLGLFAPNITSKGDMWSQSRRRMDISVYWCLKDEIVPFVPHASLWESSIEPPLLTTDACDPQSKFHRLPVALIAGMVRFASLEPLVTELKIYSRLGINN